MILAKKKLNFPIRHDLRTTRSGYRQEEPILRGTLDRRKAPRVSIASSKQACACVVVFILHLGCRLLQLLNHPDESWFWHQNSIFERISLCAAALFCAMIALVLAGGDQKYYPKWRPIRIMTI